MNLRSLGSRWGIFYDEPCTFLRLTVLYLGCRSNEHLSGKLVIVKLYQSPFIYPGALARSRLVSLHIR